jgi:hypothetical protein
MIDKTLSTRNQSQSCYKRWTVLVLVSHQRLIIMMALHSEWCATRECGTKVALRAKRDEYDSECEDVKSIS